MRKGSSEVEGVGMSIFIKIILIIMKLNKSFGKLYPSSKNMFFHNMPFHIMIYFYVMI